MLLLVLRKTGIQVRLLDFYTGKQLLAIVICYPCFVNWCFA